MGDGPKYERRCSGRICAN
jgi:hypothetical protein